jgi:diguanylate cyclase (GGDEF)-like protein
MRLTTRTDRLAVPVQPSPAVAAALVGGALLLIAGLDRATGSAPVRQAFQFVLLVAVGVMTVKGALDARRLRRLAMTDDWTGLHNLRSFEGRLATMVRAAREGHAPLALLVVDVDRLKELNDQYGHLTDAEAVRAVGGIIGRRLPPEAVAWRYGGDEFAIAIPRCPPLLADHVADDLRHAIHNTATELSGRRFAAGTLSISIGVCCASLDRAATLRDRASDDAGAGEALFAAADAALYRAKGKGRNRMCATREDSEGFRTTSADEPNDATV